ncbi:MAG: element excision factor XisH family protein [Saprospiraceae bacterium]
MSFYDPSRKLYLAIPDAIYNNFFQRPCIKLIFKIKHIKTIIPWIEN